MAVEGSLRPGGQATQTLALDMKLLAHHELAGIGGLYVLEMTV